MPGGAPQPSSTCDASNIFDALNCGTGTALQQQGETIDTLLAAIAGSAAAFGIQLFVFVLLRLRLSRIYGPRSYLVPERERVAPPPRGIVAWLVPLFATPNLTFIQKCGLDAYFFLRYLRMLLKFFLPVAVIILPILLPLNRFSDGTNQGLDKLSISNVASKYVGKRFWAHLILAIGVILWFCYVVYGELRGYIRVRQAFLTSPQHRIRASATTVLVTGIPRKWLTREALLGLYDVFPGGIKNVWINRNFDELSAKVDTRDKIAKNLEAAETSLIKMCNEEHAKKAKKEAKKAGVKKTKDELKQQEAADDAAADRMAHGTGVSAGDSHETPHGLWDVVREEQKREAKHQQTKGRAAKPLALVGDGLGVVGHSLGALGKGVGALGQRVVGDVDTGFRKAGSNFDPTVDVANAGGGFAADEALYRQSALIQSDGAPTPPPPESPAVPREEKSKDAEDVVKTEGGDGDRTSASLPQSPPAAAVSGLAALVSPVHVQHPLARVVSLQSEYSQRSPGTPASEKTLGPPSIRMTRPSVESKPKSSLQIEEPADHQAQSNPWKFWKSADRALTLPSPQPHTGDDDEFPLNASVVRAKDATAGSGSAAAQPAKDSTDKKWTDKLAFWKSSNDESKEEYPDAINKECDEDADSQPRWRRYIEPKQRETMRLPIVNQSWFPAIPLVGKKVDKIYHLRRELARLNLEIEMDQDEEDKYPFMNSAFIQFNHQVAAHMACQSLSHHVPLAMAPRLVEISPDDVIWQNMAVKWWERYLRTSVVLAVCAGLIILYAIPVTFTSLLSKINYISTQYSWLRWLKSAPTVVKSIISGLLPPLLLNLVMFLVPLIFYALVKQQGVPNGTSVELGVQKWYFAFLFIQVFFVVTLSSGLTAFFSTLASNPGKVVKSLANSLPKAADYFFSYLLVQALGNSASALVQLMRLVRWFIFAPMLDSTPRDKWRRQTNLNKVKWGSFFPLFTNFAVIGIIYSVIAPLILVFMLIIFAIFWIVYRYNILYVYQFRHDTGGLLFPTAVNQLFTGVYFLELCLIGYFFISQDPDGDIACIPQGSIMIVALVLTALYQWQLNSTLRPLLTYVPITLEDEAVIRDEEFAKAQASKFAPLRSDMEGDHSGDDEQDIQDVLESRERKEQEADKAVEAKEKKDIAERRRSSFRQPSPAAAHETHLETSPGGVSTSTQRPSWKTDRWRQSTPQAVARLRHRADGTDDEKRTGSSNGEDAQQKKDVEAQKPTMGDVLYSGYADELEDLTPEARDILVRRAFLHSALRAERPVVWIPRDRLGVSDDEVRLTEKLSTVRIPAKDSSGGGSKKTQKTNISISNVGTALTGKGKVVYGRSPPDFNQVDLIAL